VDDRTRIIALAGTLCSPRIFDPLAERLSAIARVDAVSWMTSPGPWDIPAIASWTARQIEASESTAVTLIGHSTGGAIALQLVLERPDLVAALVLVDTGPNMHSHGDVDAIIRRVESSWGPELFRSILARSFATPLDPSTQEGFLDYAGGVDQRAALEVLESQRAVNFDNRLGEIHCPTVVVHGTEDSTRSVAQAEQFASAMPGARLRLLRCGHSPMFEEPDAVAAIVRPLL
jgi:pimeloyl-ACP methyl ester carboxylesterase